VCLRGVTPWQLNDERFRSQSSSTQPSFQMTICFRSSPIHSHLFKVKEKSSYSTSLTEYHRLSRFAREMGASPSLDRVMVLTYIKFTKEFNTYDQKPPPGVPVDPPYPETRIKDIKTHIEEPMKYYKNWQRDKSNLISNGYPISTLLDASWMLLPAFFLPYESFF